MYRVHGELYSHSHLYYEYQLTKPPINNGVFKSNGINIPKAKANAGTPIIVKINAKAAPAKYNNQGVAPPSIKGLITAAIAFACGATNPR